jgi:hypothetical protein
MKKLLVYLVLWAISISANAQCIDIYGREADCPTENDSLVVYNSALKVYDFYEKNPDYVKLKSVRLKTRQDVINCFYSLQEAVDSFQIRWQLRERVLKGEDIPSVLLPRDGKNIPIDQYYQYIDMYRFYQRELESGILNVNSPFPIYDIRIAPLVVNSYENRYSSDGYNGDFVNVALYIPVVVKPYRLLTDSEKVVREKILKGVVPNKVIPKTKKVVTPTPPSKEVVKKLIKDTTLLASANIDFVLPPIGQTVIINKKPKPIPWGATPIYYQHPTGSGWLMGWMVGRKFRKFLPEDEFYSSLPKWMVDFLNNDIELEKYLRIKWGGYYDGIYE